MVWTQFRDMNSGGWQKLDWAKIYIEAPEAEAKVIFYNRFGRNPERVTCTCCGKDYAISESSSLKQASGYHRNCRSIETLRDPVTGLYRNDDPVIRERLYLDDGEYPPEGYSLSTTFRRFSAFIPLSDYIASPDVCVVYASDIKPEERIGDVPREGYVWCERRPDEGRSVMPDNPEEISFADALAEHCGLRDLIDTLLFGASAEQEANVKAVLKTYHDFRPCPGAVQPVNGPKQAVAGGGEKGE